MLVSPRAGAHLACYIIPGTMLGTKGHLTDGERRNDWEEGSIYRERETDRNEAGRKRKRKGRKGEGKSYPRGRVQGALRG